MTNNRQSPATPSRKKERSLQGRSRGSGQKPRRSRTTRPRLDGRRGFLARGQADTPAGAFLPSFLQGPCRGSSAGPPRRLQRRRRGCLLQGREVSVPRSWGGGLVRAPRGSPGHLAWLPPAGHLHASLVPLSTQHQHLFCFVVSSSCSRASAGGMDRGGGRPRLRLEPLPDVLLPSAALR